MLNNIKKELISFFIPLLLAVAGGFGFLMAMDSAVTTANNFLK